MAFLLEKDMKIPECACRTPQGRTASAHSFSIQGILGLDKNAAGDQKPASVGYERETTRYFSNNLTDPVIKVEPRSPTSTHLGTVVKYPVGVKLSLKLLNYRLN